MPWRIMKPLANSLLPSSVAPLAVGPMMSMWLVVGSSLKLSKMPCTSGSSGPTTIMSMPFSRANALSAGKSVAFIFTFSPTAPVPAFPGAMYSFSTFGLWAIFHAKACSRPPEPNSNIFISNLFLVVSLKELEEVIDNPRSISLSSHADARGRVRQRCACAWDR